MERKSVGRVISSSMAQPRCDQTTSSSSLFGCSGSDQMKLALEDFIKRVYLRKDKIVIFHIKSGKSPEK